jgi:hypothetical protein
MSLESVLYDIQKAKDLQEKMKKEGKNFKEIKESAFETMERAARSAYGDTSRGYMSVSEAITSTDSMKLIPKVVEGQLREAAEPEYLGTNFFQKVKVDGGGNQVTYVIPVVGEIRAYEVGEATRYKENQPDFNTLENTNISIQIKKVGVKVSITEEALNDSSWDIFNINIRKMGRALARYKEEMIFNTFSTHGHKVFDNALRYQNPAAGTTGLGKDGQFNDTLSVEDFLDLTMCLLGQGFNPTDVIMHPLVWVVFAKNSMIGNGLTFGALGGNNVHPNGAIQGTPAAFGMANNGDGQKFIMRPEQVQNRLPFGLQVNMSPWVAFDKANKKFDMYCVDRNEVGIIAQREEVTTDDWIDPERDVQFMKAKERYGIGLLNNGKAITVIRNIAVAASYPAQPVINVNTGNQNSNPGQYPNYPKY